MVNFFHKQIFPILLALVLSILLLGLLLKSNVLIKKNHKTIHIIEDSSSNEVFFPNLLSQSSELNLYSSLINKDQITILGSSELTGDFTYLPHNFLNDSLQIRTISFGHAYQQSFAMYCQLLAFQKEIKNSNICFIISPGWFEQGGTNIEAFLEFVRPNFLKRIIKNQTVSREDKEYIGKYIFSNYENIANPSSELNYFYKLYKHKDLPILSDYFINKFIEFEAISYQALAHPKKNTKKINFNFSDHINLAMNSFKLNVKSNSYFINDDYFNTYIKQKDGSLLNGEFGNIIASDNGELRDFNRLVKLLEEQNVNASFIIQPLNPYHYKKLDRFNPFITHISKVLKKANFPLLNLFTSNKKKYIPGTLNDIMHFGDVGWLFMNEFLVKTYMK